MTRRVWREEVNLLVDDTAGCGCIVLATGFAIAGLAGMLPSLAKFGAEAARCTGRSADLVVLIISELKNP